MDDDFNTPEAIAALFDLATEVNKSRNQEVALLLRDLAVQLGFLARAPGAFHQAEMAGLSAEEITELIAQRVSAKKEKNFARADQIRAELLEKGVVLEDSPSGTTWRNL